MRKFLFFSVLLFTAGCAAPRVIEPTGEELAAVRQYKKTVAIMDFQDNGSSIKGIKELTQGILEKMMVRHFNLVERRNMDSLMKEIELGQSGVVDTQKIVEAGKMAGADYVITGSVAATLIGPTFDSSSGFNKGKFSGWTKETITGEADVNLRMVEVATSEIYYADRKKAALEKSLRWNSYSDQAKFDEAVRLKAQAKETRDILKPFVQLDQEFSSLVADSVDAALRKFENDFNKKFAHSGEVLQIISPKEVLINLGSAYGIVPGQKLVVWDETTGLVDPKTGLSITTKKEKAVLKVTQVNSGLSCVAKADAKVIQRLKVGDKVFTY